MRVLLEINGKEIDIEKPTIQTIYGSEYDALEELMAKALEIIKDK